MSTSTAIPSYDEAVRAALTGVPRTSTVESVPLERAAGRVLARPVAADRDLPPFDRATMDGYAVRLAGRRGRSRRISLPVQGTVMAGAADGVSLEPDSAVRIATGAPVPEGADTVVPRERASGDREVTLDLDGLEVGYAIHPRGRDATAKQIVLPAGLRLGAHHLGIAASVGAVRLECVAEPRVAVLTSGDEIVGPDQPVLAHQVRDAGGIMLETLVPAIGGRLVERHHLPDERDAVVEAVARSLESAEIVVTIGGVSVGDRDHVPAAMDEAGVRRSVDGVRMQPGRPVRIGLAPDGQVIVGLPGNPVSALACACLFLWPLVRAMTGRRADLPWMPMMLAASARPNWRREAFRPAHVDTGAATVTVPRWSGSGDLVHVAETDGLVALPAGPTEWASGTGVRVLPWPSAWT